MKLHIRICVTGGSLGESFKDEICVRLNKEAFLVAMEKGNITWDEVDAQFIRLHQLERADSGL